MKHRTDNLEFRGKKSVALLTDTIGVSFGTLTLLGLTNARSLEKPTTAHFLLGEHCVNSCSFCSQAKRSKALPNQLSRVTWPEVSWTEISTPLAGAIDRGDIKRACLQIVESPGATNQAVQLIRNIRGISRIFPISVCVAPTSISRAGLFFRAGASQIGLPIDAASKEIYNLVKGRGFDESWGILRQASEKWPGRISTHLIAGLGETEEDIVRSIARARGMGITVGLFAFTPVKGTQMEDEPPPLLGSYRRIQLAAYVLGRGGSIEQMGFEDGKISYIRISSPEILREVRKGIPFQTSGCPDCNRPYYNERPGQVPMNYPRPLSAHEASDCLLDSELNLG